MSDDESVKTIEKRMLMGISVAYVENRVDGEAEVGYPVWTAASSVPKVASFRSFLTSTKPSCDSCESLGIIT
jgi:hypothetical protein